MTTITNEGALLSITGTNSERAILRENICAISSFEKTLWIENKEYNVDDITIDGNTFATGQLALEYLINLEW